MAAKQIYSLSLIIIYSLLLASCASVTRGIQKLGNTSNYAYPAAQPSCPEFAKPAFIKLANYKSVHSRHLNRGNTAVALAASGGGYRAANLTLGVLLGLEKMKSSKLHGNLLNEVDYYSSVSGGGFGVGYYLTQLHNHYSRYEYGKVIPVFSLNKNVQSMLITDKNMLTTDASNPLRMDLTEYLFFGKNRGFELEKRLSDTILKTPQGSLKLGDIFVARNSSKKVRLPYWATNSTIYQNAAALPFTPDVLADYRVSGYYHNRMLLQSSSSDVNYTYSIPAAVGVTASASLPFALPSTTLISDSCEDQCYLQLYDGGLSDNLGVYTALNFLLQDKNKIKVLIVVDASKNITQPYSKLPTAPENVTLLWRVLTAGTDANRERVKPSINLVTRELLCASGASHVIVAYLDLSHSPEAQHINTQLSITPENQKLLLKIGEELVTKNKTFKTFIKQMNEGNLTLGQCGKKS